MSAPYTGRKVYRVNFHRAPQPLELKQPGPLVPTATQRPPLHHVQRDVHEVAVEHQTWRLADCYFQRLSGETLATPVGVSTVSSQGISWTSSIKLMSRGSSACSSRVGQAERAIPSPRPPRQQVDVLTLRSHKQDSGDLAFPKSKVALAPRFSPGYPSTSRIGDGDPMALQVGRTSPCATRSSDKQSSLLVDDQRLQC